MPLSITRECRSGSATASPVRETLAGRLFRYFDTGIRGRLALTALILLVSEVVGQVAFNAQLPVASPTTKFVQEQMVGRSSVAHYYLGLIALRKGEYREAQRSLQIAMQELEGDVALSNCRRLLARTAYRNRDYEVAASSFAELPWESLGIGDALKLSIACFETNRLGEGLAVLDRLETEYPDNVEIVYNRALASYRNGLIGEQELREVIDGLLQRENSAQAQGLAANLRLLLERGPGGP